MQMIGVGKLEIKLAEDPILLLLLSKAIEPGCSERVKISVNKDRICLKVRTDTPVYIQLRFCSKVVKRINTHRCIELCTQAVQRAFRPRTIEPRRFPEVNVG